MIRPAPRHRPALATLVFALASLLPRAATAQEPAPQAATEGTAFVGVRVLDTRKRTVAEDQVVLVSGGRIQAVGARAGFEIPHGWRTVAGEGHTLIAGLAEMHGHLPNAGWPAGMSEDVLFLYLANGVTFVRGMLGEPAQLELRGRLERGEVLGPRLAVGSPPLSGGGLDAGRAAELVRQYQSAGYDHLKVHEGLRPEAYDAIAKTAREVGITWGGHVADLVGLEHALDAGQVTIDHLDNVVESLTAQLVLGAVDLNTVVTEASEERLALVARWMLRNDASVVPTMALWRTFMGGIAGAELVPAYDELKYIPPQIVQQWVAQVRGGDAEQRAAGERVLGWRNRALGALSDAGVRILLGTDSPQLFSVPGFSLHREIAAMQVAGLGPWDILHAGTTAVADFYRWKDHGAVAPGFRADLVLVEGAPEQDLGALREIAGVMIGGRWIPKKAIDERLAAIAARFGD
ncbi:MAG TPA: amidohydrolase family protein [Planctomycetota bacterium]